MLKFSQLIAILLISNLHAQNNKVEIFGDILHDEGVICSMYKMVKDHLTLLSEETLDSNRYNLSLSLDETYVIAFEGESITKFIYVASVFPDIMRININYSKVENKHLYIFPNYSNDEYLYRIMTDQEVQDYLRERKMEESINHKLRVQGKI